MRSPVSDPIATDTSPGAILQLIRAGVATSRREIAKRTGLAPSTAALRVESLLHHGFVEETGGVNPRGGRVPRTLRIRPGRGHVVSVILGVTTTRVCVADHSGQPLDSSLLTLDLRAGAEPVLTAVWQHVNGRLDERDGTTPAILGIAIGLPAPVDTSGGRTSAAAQLPRWETTDLTSVARRIMDVPIVLENDANLLALAEHTANRDIQDLLSVKLDERIGAGIIAAGRLFTGAKGAAGEISHSSTDGDPTIECSCNNRACLESVASGAAIVARLRADGYTVPTVNDLVALATTGDPHVIQVLRDAGRLVGTTLSEIINFMNPEHLVFGGALAAVPAHVAAIRAEVHRICLPVISDGLVIRSSTNGELAENIGGIERILDLILSPAAVNNTVRHGRP